MELSNTKNKLFLPVIIQKTIAYFFLLFVIGHLDRTFIKNGY
jgi:hypothetical protein